MKTITGPFQASFIPGRLALDNIIMAKEILHSLKKQRGGSCGMIIKVDLKKAHDRVDWTFLKAVMGFLGFGEHLVELTLDIIRGTELAVCWNGEVLPSFKPSRGLRQEVLYLLTYLSYAWKH